MNPTVTQKYIPYQEPSPFLAYDQRGFPWRQGALPLKMHEMDDVRYSGDFHCQAFNLSNSEEMAAYSTVMDQIVNRKCRPVGAISEPFWDADGKVWRTILRWVDIFAEVPIHTQRTLGMLK